MQNQTIVVSVVSHGQGALVHRLLADLAQHERATAIVVVMTCNVAEKLPFTADEFPFPIHMISNSVPAGFAANHNAAFDWCVAQGMEIPFYCIINPDIRLHEAVFVRLCAQLTAQHLGLIAPLVKNSGGVIEDSARQLPTPFKVLSRALSRTRSLDYDLTKGGLVRPDWVAGMFMLLTGSVYASVKLDDNYFLYYEDVDFCCRLRLAGFAVGVDTAVSVIHDAHRSSHTNLKYLRWHLASMARFFFSSAFSRCRRLHAIRAKHI